MDNIQEPSNPECHIPLSETFRIYICSASTVGNRTNDISMYFTQHYLPEVKHSIRFKSMAFWGAMSCNLVEDYQHSSKILMDFYWTLWCYITKCHTLHSHSCEYLKSILCTVFSAKAKLIFRLQKRAIRTMMQIRRTASCKQYFKYLHILPLPCLYIYVILVYINSKFESSYNQFRNTLI
jgi:hypothetical protein